MLHTRSYTLVVENHPADGGYLAKFPALPGCHSWGTTYEEAVRNGEEALMVFIDSLWRMEKGCLLTKVVRKLSLSLSW